MLLATCNLLLKRWVSNRRPEVAQMHRNVCRRTLIFLCKLCLIYIN